MPAVLVVDDDIDLLEMVAMALTMQDFQVECLSKGQQLFETLSLSKPDLLLMDIYLGDADGRELCRTLKKSEQFRDIPTILYSAGYITASSIRDSLADDFIVKPFDITILGDKIKSLAK